MIGMDAVAMFGAGFNGVEAVVLSPVSKVGGSGGIFNRNPTPVTLVMILLGALCWTIKIFMTARS